MRGEGVQHGKVSPASSVPGIQALARTRRRKVLIALVACTICLLAAEAGAAWRRPPGGSKLRANGGSGDQRQLLHQLAGAAAAPVSDAHAPAPAGAKPNASRADSSSGSAAGEPSQAPPPLPASAPPPSPAPAPASKGPAPRLPPPKPPVPPPPPQRRAVLRLPEVDERSPDQCAEALRLPRVALLFLTRGDLYHHAAWADWFGAARDLVPAANLRAAACETADKAPAPAPAAKGRLLKSVGGGDAPAPPPAAAEPQVLQIVKACGWNASSGQPLAASDGGASGDSGSGNSSSSPIDQQHLFSVYIHAPPSVKDGDLPEVFRGRLVTDRLTPSWGSHLLVEATRNLLWEAFRDPLNERFVLLSESDIPLYDPLTMHQQLLAERKSRINACWSKRQFEDRWTWRMASPNLKKGHWRKGGQWFGLMRQHVQVVLQDSELFRRFEQHCVSGFDADYNRFRGCVSDEHYIHTLLAAKGLADETSCHSGGVNSADWSKGGDHPKSYGAGEVQPELFRLARREDEGCNAAAAIEDARRMFITKADAFGASQPAGAGRNASDDGGTSQPQALCGRLLASRPPTLEHPLGIECPLTVRKFPKPTAAAVRKLFTDCDNGLHLLAGAGCTELPGGPAAAQQH